MLENMLMKLESKKVVDKEEKCSSSKNVESEIKCNLKFYVKHDELIFQASDNKF